MLEVLHPLPVSRRLEVGALARLFDDATTSYKHLFFRAILDGYRERGFAGTRFTLKALTVGMLEAAWYPSKVFTFVCHDAIWNLVPVIAEANLSKNNSLPDRTYLPAIAAIQHAGLTVARRVMTKAVWERVANTFVGDLRISEEAILDRAQLECAYELSVGAQLNIAWAIGFKPDWKFNERNWLRAS